MADDPFGNLLRLRSSMPSSKGGALPKRGCSLQLQLELSWPLTAFLPPVGLLGKPVHRWACESRELPGSY